MKEIRFNEELGHLVDGQGGRYEGKRIGTVDMSGSIDYRYDDDKNQ